MKCGQQTECTKKPCKEWDHGILRVKLHQRTVSRILKMEFAGREEEISGKGEIENIFVKCLLRFAFYSKLSATFVAAKAHPDYVL